MQERTASCSRMRKVGRECGLSDITGPAPCAYGHKQETSDHDHCSNAGLMIPSHGSQRRYANSAYPIVPKFRCHFL